MKIKFLCLIWCYFSTLSAFENLPDLLSKEYSFSNFSFKPDLLRKEILKKRPKKLTSASTLIELENQINDFQNLNNSERTRFIILVQELQDKYDLAYLKLKTLANDKGKLWYQMNELYLTEKLGLESEKNTIGKALTTRLLLDPLAIKKIQLCSRVKGYGLYTAIKNQQIKSGEKVIIYVEIEGLYQKKSKNGNYTSSCSGTFSVEDEEGNLVFQKNEKIMFPYKSNSIKRDYYVWLMWKPLLRSGVYNLVFEIKDEKNSNQHKEKHSFTIL